jgi:hypothetical protein
MPQRRGPGSSALDTPGQGALSQHVALHRRVALPPPERTGLLSGGWAPPDCLPGILALLRGGVVECTAAAHDEDRCLDSRQLSGWLTVVAARSRARPACLQVHRAPGSRAPQR